MVKWVIKIRKKFCAKNSALCPMLESMLDLIRCFLK